MSLRIDSRVQVSRHGQRFTGVIVGYLSKPGKPTRWMVRADGDRAYSAMLLSDRYVVPTRRKQAVPPEALRKMGYYGPIASGRKKPPIFGDNFW